jgi:RimJ/RimL family protein N-acetyltransferase
MGISKNSTAAGSAPATSAILAPLTAVSIRDDRIAIGPLLPDDSRALFLWLNDIEAANQDLTFRPFDWLTFQTWLAEIGKNPSRVFFAIRKLQEPEIVGYLALTNISPVHRSAELGIRIGAEADRGRGYGKAAVALALKYAWENLNLHRVYLTVLANNTRAISSYAAAGFEEEGRLRHGAFIAGGWKDVVMMGALCPSAQADMHVRPAFNVVGRA